MKQIFATIFVGMVVALFAGPLQSFAQTADTVWVPASPEGNITNFINGDTTSTGARNNPNRVYQLYDDSVYYYTGGTYNGIVVNGYHLTIIAPTPAPGHYPPEINPMIHNDGSITYHFIEDYQGSITLKNLYIQGVRPDEATGGSYAIQLSGDTNSVISADSCVFDGWYFRAIGGAGTHNSYYFSNCKFMNGTDPGGQFDGQVWGILSGAIADTVSFTDNTFFCNNSYLLMLSGTALCRYLDFNHNTVFLGVVNPLWLFQAVNANITNNIFYGTFAGGAIPAEIVGGWYDTDGQPPAVISLDTLSTVGSLYNLTEADRHINVIDNAYYWPKQLTDFYTHWNDSVTTAKADSEIITPPVWMNSRTAAMFGDKQMWPNFDSSGNVEVDPQFPSSAMGQVDSLVQYVYLDRANQLGTYNWWYIPEVNAANGNNGPYPGVWPLPWSLAYTNSSLMQASTDGKPLGDLNWFPSQLPLPVQQLPKTVPTKFALSNNYPNPFNPTTTVKVTLAKSGVASLRVYNVLGQLVKVVDQGYKPAGSYVYNINMDQFASGVYFYSLQQGPNIITKKMLLLK